MVAERSWILGVFVCALAVPTACGGISVSTLNDGEAGDSSGGVGANGGTGLGAAPGAGGGGNGGVGAAGGNPPTPAGGSIQAGGSGGASTGGKGGFSIGGSSTGGSFTGGTGTGATGMGGTGMGATGGVMPMGGTGGTLPRPDLRIPWDGSGFIHATDNAFGIQGRWYLATDCGSTAGTGLECTKQDASLIGPDMQPGWATSPERVCMRGVAPQIVNNPSTGMPAYDLQWGALFGFSLADGGAYDADVYNLHGFQFDLTANFEASIRVNVVSTTTVGFAHFAEIFLPSPNLTVLFSDVQQGSWVVSPVPLNTHALTSVEFHVYTSTVATTPFDVCVSNLRAVLW